MASTPAFAQQGRPPGEKGMALGLFSADPGYDYGELLEEIRALGATHVTIDWVWWQKDVRASSIAPVSTWSATDAQIVEAMARAKALGLYVTAFPILRLIDPEDGKWRGQIAPAELDRWWESYGEFIMHAADLAVRGGAQRLCIGSELLSRERERERWKDLIDRLRMKHPELELMYSANWDHFEPVAFWDLVDVVGLTAYWELTRDPDASTYALLNAWTDVRRVIRAFTRRLGRPVVFTEIGYPSLDGGAVWPWNEQRRAAPDPDEQERAYLAFTRAWSDTPELAGVYFWNWFGFGGPEDTSYTPRRKPAERVIRDWFGAAK